MPGVRKSTQQILNPQSSPSHGARYRTTRQLLGTMGACLEKVALPPLSLAANLSCLQTLFYFC